MKHSRNKQYLCWWLLFSFHNSIASDFNYFRTTDILSSLDKILLNYLLVMFFSFLQLFSKHRSIKLNLSTQKYDDIWFFIGSQKKLLLWPYFGIESKPSNHIKILVFIVGSEEGCEYEKQFDLFYLFVGPVSFIFSEYLEQRHQVLYWIKYRIIMKVIR